MGTQKTSDLRTRYLETLIRQNSQMDVRIVLQMQRMLEPSLDSIFVPLDVREREPVEIKTLAQHFEAPDASKIGDPSNPKFPKQTGAPRLLRRCSFSELIASEPRIVLLGDPGAGKTTLAKWLTLKLAETALGRSQTVELTPTIAGLLPVPVTLRYFAEAAKKQGHPLEALEHYLAGPAWTRDFPDAAREVGSLVREAWLSGQAYFLFDGLDEAIDLESRRFVSTSIYYLSQKSAGSCFLVTSRPLGYDAAPLPPWDWFSVWQVEPFNTGQARSYVQKWSRVVEQTETTSPSLGVDPYLEARVERRVTELLGPLHMTEGDDPLDQAPPELSPVEQSVRRLMANPLFCTLVGLIHHQGQQMPRDRAELYRLCLEAFIYDWEVRKRNDPAQKRGLDKHETLDVLEELAFQLHDGDGSNVFSGEKIKFLVGEFLRNTKGYSPEAATERAAELLWLIQLRAGLLIEKSEGIWGFSHLQFQEYLAGRALVREPAETGRLLGERLLQQRWQEPIVLAAAHLSAFNERQGGEFIRAILDAPAPDYPDNWEPLLRHRLILACRAAADARRVHFQIQKRLAELAGSALSDPSRRYLWWSLAETRCQFRDPAALQPLLALLKDKDPAVRYNAAQALGQFRDPATLQPLLALLKDKDPVVRYFTVRALGQFRNPAILEHLLALLRDKGPAVRSSAAQALGQFRNPAILPRLLAMLKDEDSAVRYYAAHALGQFRDRAVLPPLLALLKDKAPPVRSSAARALGQFRDPTILEHLFALLRDRSSAVRSSAAHALGQFRDPATLPRLLALLKDKDPAVCSAAARALGQFRDPTILEHLLALLNDKYPAVRSSAARALGQFRDPAAVPRLLALLKDKNPTVRSSAARAFGQFRDPAALQPLLILAEDKDSDVRSSAARALGQFRDPAALQSLLVLIEDKDSDVRYFAAGALEQFRDPVALQPLLALLKDKDPAVRSSAASAIEQLKLSPSEQNRLVGDVCAKLADPSAAEDWPMYFSLAQAHLLR